MQYIKISDQNLADSYLSSAIINHLEKNRHVVWIVSGGSNVPISVKVLNQLPEDKLTRLTVMLGDERYLEFGNPQTNQKKLEDAKFDFHKVAFVPILSSGNLSVDKTAANFETAVNNIFSKAEVIIGQFGIGADGHTAGILPHSPAADVHDRLVTYYRAPDYVRITLTFEALKKINEAYIYVFGETKRQVLEQLDEKYTSLSDVPAQIYKYYINDSFIINDLVGESV